MHTFSCANCGQMVFFENSVCLRCGRSLGFTTDDWTLRTFAPREAGHYTTQAGPATPYRRCANAGIAACNWMVPEPAPPGALCAACLLTRTRPNDADAAATTAFAAAEAAKRRLVYQLHDLDLPIVSRLEDPEEGLAFDLLSSGHEPVVTGHEDGVITIDLAESDDAHRTQVQQRLGEPYRTLLGHFRHEIGHYYWSVFFGRDPQRLAACRALFGDDEADYAAAIERHYADGPGTGWERHFVSSYATMHPYEDWAETFAHYLHIRDTLQTAASFGVRVAGPATESDLPVLPHEQFAHAGIQAVIDEWLPLTYALNSVNRSMGKDDLYPFVLAAPVVEKLAFVHDLWRTVTVGIPT